MLNKYFYILIVLILSISCGREITLTNNKLERQNSSSTTEALRTLQEGILIRSSTDQISLNGQTYRVSAYSSYLAKKFIASQLPGSQTAVRFKGQLNKGEMEIEQMEKR